MVIVVCVINVLFQDYLVVNLTNSHNYVGLMSEYKMSSPDKRLNQSMLDLSAEKTDRFI